MKRRAMAWDAEKDDSSDDESSSSSDTDSSGHKKTKRSSETCQPSIKAKTEVKNIKRKNAGIGFEDLRRHGYKGGLSVLSVPAPKNEGKNQDWSWRTGREHKEEEECYEEREKTRAAIANGEILAGVQTRGDRGISFAHKEKRKREIGQVSRAKNYVEEEKRVLRESGIYSGFDS